MLSDAIILPRFNWFWKGSSVCQRLVRGPAVWALEAEGQAVLGSGSDVRTGRSGLWE